MNSWRVVWAVIASAVVALAGLAAIVWLSTISPDPTPVVSSPTPSETPAEQPGQPPSKKVPPVKRLTFAFTDHGGTPRSFTCTIRGADYDSELESFGVDIRLFWQEVNAELKKALEGEAWKKGLARFFRISVEGHALPIFQRKTLGMPEARRIKVEAFAKWLDEEGYAEMRREIKAQAYRKRGFVLVEESSEDKPDRIEVDYARIVDNAAGPLADCARALRNVGASAKEERLASLFLAFFQELEYEVPPDPDARGRITLGFRVPSEVLLEKAGDCDSKAAAFCAMWRQLPGRAMIIFVPSRRHILVGVEGNPGPGEVYGVVGNRSYVVCEVAGSPEKGAPKLPPGVTNYPGTHPYLLIESVGTVNPGDGLGPEKVKLRPAEESPQP